MVLRNNDCILMLLDARLHHQAVTLLLVVFFSRHFVDKAFFYNTIKTFFVLTYTLHITHTLLYILRLQNILEKKSNNYLIDEVINK